MSQNGPKVYSDDEVVQENLSAQSGDNVVLYAVWDLDIYNISYDLK